MYETLKRFHERPAPFSYYTTDTLWTDPHISGRMLGFHLDESSDLASRRPAVIDGIVDWIDRYVGLAGKRVCDIGCGPGLYALRMARRGAAVTGIDFSTRSVDHARRMTKAEGADATFIVGDYLKDEIPGGQDLVCLIYGDMCAMSAENRRAVTAKVRRALKPGGLFIFDLFSQGQFAERAESTSFARNMMDGFWSAADYFGFLKVFLYPEECVALDRYLIVEDSRSFEVFNWMRYYSPQAARAEFDGNGFQIERLVDVSTGAPWTLSASPFAVIARAS
ncbi:class I SAM-dependent methyltransferase [Xanthobacteraceae bacterium Astr-EGSB]|uniref:class I SAM-dependent methyltransferase n=1 Tax=Astrobacterium formosum TaxID=3069710 RepID=UPI0027AF066D|nr:class I SAM-dependent methyltransferase [Xanthobacteraceae bacterium Astr-EGSB]